MATLHLPVEPALREPLLRRFQQREQSRDVPPTTMIACINSELRRSTGNRGSFPSDEALVTVLYLRCKETGRTARGRGHVGKTGYAWKTALHQFDIMFPGRLELA